MISDALTPVIRTQGLTAHYRSLLALEDVTFTVRPGMRVGVIGPNGAGKSTMLRCLMGLIQPTRGEVEVLGRTPRRARRHVGFLPQRQEVDLTFPARVRDVVGMGRYPHRGPIGRTRPDDRDAVERAMAHVAIDHLASTPLSELSGGQQQRTFLARALAQDTDLLIMDEPYANVDATTCAMIDRVLISLRSAGRTAVVVDHQLDRVQERYDQVLVLNTVLHHDGTPDTATEASVLKRAYAGSALIIDGDQRVMPA